VANEKRQRQDLNRQAKVVEQQTIAQKEKAVNQRKKILQYVAIGVATVVVVALLSRCGKKSDSAADTTIPAAPISAATSSTKPAPPTTLPEAIAKKPVVTIPSGAAPTKLETKDLVVGTGPEIKAGDTVEMNYVGVAWSTKKEFDSSWSRSQTFPVENVGNGPVIQGWNEGLIGMKEGGRRQLIIPPDKGYGAQGAGGDIGPNETLVFVVDAVKVSGKK
jgi:peptidylprolyl isomerase